MNRAAIVLLAVAGLVLLTAAPAYATCCGGHMYSGQSACTTEFATAAECEDACIGGGWDWCEWDPNPGATCNPDNTCPAPTQFFHCGQSTGCCEGRDSLTGAQDGCMNDATYNECEQACQDGNYTWCRWTPTEVCDGQGVCDGPNSQIIEGCARGCCEGRDSQIGAQDGCMDDASYDECVDACRAGQYAWCRWTPAQNCNNGVCAEGPGTQMILDCGGIPTVTEWGLLTLALVLLTAGAVVAYRRRATQAQ